MVLNTPSCQAYSPEISNPFGYKPSLAPGIVFVILFFLSSSTHAIQAFRYRTWWGSLFAIGAGAECLGWIARTAASKCAYSSVLFTMQISILIFAPAFTTAGLYVILFKMIPFLGKRSSPFPPKLCLYICLCVDIISLALQAAGGGLAGKAFKNNLNTQPGTYTMVAGILFQLASTIAYSILMSIVFTRGFTGLRSSKTLMRLAAAMVAVICCMITRGVYRSIELLQGWQGYLNTHQQFVIGLDGSFMLLAVLILNVLNPGMLLGVAEKEMPLKEGIDGEKAAKMSSSEDCSVV